jgi:hypothetical protein
MSSPAESLPSIRATERLHGAANDRNDRTKRRLYGGGDAMIRGRDAMNRVSTVQNRAGLCILLSITGCFMLVLLLNGS